MSEQDINVTDPIFEWAHKAPWAVAIIEGDQIVHYRTLCSAILRAMVAFREAGCSPGQVVGISLEGSVSMQLVVSLALARAGITQVWLPLDDPMEYRAQRAHALGVATVIANHERGLLKPITHFVPDASWLSASGADTTPADLRVCGTYRPLILIQSSGTTGSPKDIVMSHDEEILLAMRSNTASACLPGERSMSLTGIRFWSGVTRAWRCLFAGGAFVLPPAKWTSEELLRCIDLHHVTFLACTPMHIRILLDGIRGDAPRLPGLRVLRCTTATLPVSDLQEVARRISPNIHIHYGTSEAGAIAAAPPALLNRYPDCVGLPLEGIELEIVDESNQPVKAGILGHIRVRGAGIGSCQSLGASTVGASMDLWANEQEWNYPGDVGFRNAEGILFLKGRSDDIMNFDGIMVGPAELESVLGRHPAVADSAAFPLPSPVHQDIPAAAVVLKQPIPLEELAQYCRQHLGIRAPRMFFVMDVIPRNPMGKILRRRLTEIAVAHMNPGAA